MPRVCGPLCKDHECIDDGLERWPIFGLGSSPADDSPCDSLIQSENCNHT
jgi:hypothetical protein